MANWHPRDRRDDNYRERIRRNYEDVEFATKPDSDRRDYERDVLGYRSGNSDARMSDYNRYTADRDDFRRERYRTEPTYEQMYDAATRDYAGYGDNGSQWRQTVDRDLSSTGNRYNRDDRIRDRANIRDEGRYTDGSAYNPRSQGRDFGPDEFGRGYSEYRRAYGDRGVQTRPTDYDRNRGSMYGGRPEARGWRPDEETSALGPHRGRGPKDYKRSDERIREDVNDRLTDDHDLDASSINVSVKDGEVTLSGSVSSKRDKRRAEDIADSVSGVGHVQNNLRSNGSAMMAGACFTTGVESASGATTETNNAWSPTGTAAGSNAQQKPGTNGASFG